MSKPSGSGTSVIPGYEAQVTHHTNFIQSHPGWELAGIFADEGLSGTQAKTRPQFNALIAACESGAVNLVMSQPAVTAES